MTNAKQKAKDRDNWKCRFCGLTDEEHKEKYERGVHAHHVVKSRSGGADSPENLITVCRDCHQILEQTQADALDRIKRGDPTELESVKEQRDALLERVHYLERFIRSGAVFSLIEGEHVHGNVITEMVGNRVVATTDDEKAYSEYQEFGSQVRRMNFKVDEANVQSWQESDVLSRKVDKALRLEGARRL